MNRLDFGEYSGQQRTADLKGAAWEAMSRPPSVRTRTFPGVRYSAHTDELGFTFPADWAEGGDSTASYEVSAAAG